MPLTNPLAIIYGDIASAIGEMVNYVDVDLGQLKKGGENIPIDYPAVIIKMENVSWTGTSNQKGLVHVRLKVIYPYIDETEYYTLEHGLRTEVFTFYQLIYNINESVMAIDAASHSDIVRFNECHLDSLPGERKWVYVLDYMCNIHANGDDIEPNVDYDDVMIAKQNILLERTIDSKKLG